ncbi:MAG: hypothetical protein WC979_08495 [Candidatus Pacearchaeota archaeon]|jgi:hypothetical protein
MKKLRVYVVETDVGKAETLANRLNTDKGILNDYDIEFVGGTFGCDHPLDSVALLDARPDMYIMDHATANMKSSENSLAIAEQIKTQYPFLPILLMHRGEQKERYKVLRSALNNESEGNVKVFDGFIDPWMKTPEIQKTVKTNLRKPLDIGIIGLGAFGRQILRTFTRANEINRIKAYSEHVPYETVSAAIDHLGARTDKVSFVNSLEDTLENTDCVLICTSSMHTSDLAKRLAKQDDRLDLLPQEAAKLFSYFKRIKQANYQGLINPFTNPIAGMFGLAKKAGIKHAQLTTPINIDNARFEDAIRQGLGRNYTTYFNALMQGKIVGEHGVPQFAQLTDKQPKNDDPQYERMMEKLHDLINDSLIKARQMPIDALQSSAILEERNYEAVIESAKFYKRLANLDEKPNESAYCYYTINGTRGFTALPIKVSYFPEIRVAPNEEYIQKFDRKAMKCLGLQLTLQNLYTQRVIASGVLGEN